MNDFCDCCRRPTGACLVLREFRDLVADGGRERARQRYLDACRERAEELEQGGNLEDLRKRVIGSGAPVDAALAAERPEDTQALQGAKQFENARGYATFLLLLGSTGIGKTVAASWVLREFCRRHDWNSGAQGTNLFPAMFVVASKLTRLSSFEDADRHWVEQIRKCGLLVLDDLGDEATEIGKNVVVELLLDRHAKKRRTVITSNLVAKAFRDRYGAAIADRINEAGIKPTLSDGVSKRRQPQELRFQPRGQP